MPHVFVYGTLKRGGSNHHLIAAQRFVNQAKTAPVFRLYELEGYPGMVAASANGCSVEGEIWEVDAPCLSTLDELEGTGSGLYARVPVPLLPPHEHLRVEAYIYLLSIEGKRDAGSSWAV